MDKLSIDELKSLLLYKNFPQGFVDKLEGKINYLKINLHSSL
jgi:hypothetical protein